MAKVKFRPECLRLPEMSEAELRALAADMDEVGQLVDVLLYKGDVIDGRSRVTAIEKYCKSGLKPRFTEYSGDLPAFRLAYSLNVPRRHLSAGQKALLVLDSWDEYKRHAKERMSDGGKKARGGTGATPSVPRKARDDAAKDAGVAPRTMQDAVAVKEKGSAKLVEAVKEDKVSVKQAAAIVRQTEDKTKQNAILTSVQKSNNSNRVTGLTGEVEWYTPAEYIESARVVMGGIDLDPASSDLAQQTVKAGSYFTLEKNAFDRNWFGNVFLNPPYKMPDVAQFVVKLTDEIEAGRVLQAVMLTNTASDSSWYRMAWARCTLLCQTGHRIRFFECRDGEVEQRPSPTCNQTFFYFGPKHREFMAEFRRHGNIAKLVARYERESA